jgi:hypothetical protein
VILPQQVIFKSENLKITMNTAKRTVQQNSQIQWTKRRDPSGRIYLTDRKLCRPSPMGGQRRQ